MNVNELIKAYPKVYHMAEKDNWENICKYGLLSATALLDLFECKGEERFKIESQIRTASVSITHPKHGKAIIRDQKPMRDRPEDGVSLKGCLVGITTQEWFELLNCKVFFWTDIHNLNIMLRSINYRNYSYYIFVVDTRKLLKSLSGKVILCSLNSGSIYYNRTKRSKDTFKPINNYSQTRAKELAVEYSIPNITKTDLLISVYECKGFYSENNKIWPS